MTPRRAAIYVRISVATEHSVSLERQTESARQYAAARGWDVAAVFRDEGVSANLNKPADRAGWRALLDSSEQFDTVIIWKLDRLARRVLDFHTANESLVGRGAALVAVENSIDMATPDGKLIANVLASFAEYESDAIRSRVRAAREHLIRSGRVVGGTVPYGWRSSLSTTGPGYVLIRDPERIKWVRGMAERTLAGGSIYSTTKWLTASGAPLPEASQVNRKQTGWHHSTVERLLRNPILAGMTRYNPGAARHTSTDPTAVLRDENGLPVVDDNVAIMSPAEWRALLSTLDARDSPQSMPRASKGVTSPLLAGLATCNDCDRVMSRGTNSGRAVLTCRYCHQTIAGKMLADHLERRLLAERGDARQPVRGQAANLAPELAAIEHAIRGVLTRLAADDGNEKALVAELSGLKAERQNVRLREIAATPVALPDRLLVSGTVAKRWGSASSDLERRTVLVEQIESLRIARGRRGGRHFDTSRVHLIWRATIQDIRHANLGDVPPTIQESLREGISMQAGTLTDAHD